MRITRLSAKHNTPHLQQPPQFVTITHPAHPLCGQKVEVVTVHKYISPQFIVRLPDGNCVKVDVEWTDCWKPPDNVLPTSTEHQLDIHGLCRIVKMINLIKEQGRFLT